MLGGGGGVRKMVKLGDRWGLSGHKLNPDRHDISEITGMLSDCSFRTDKTMHCEPVNLWTGALREDHTRRD